MNRKIRNTAFRHNEAIKPEKLVIVKTPYRCSEEEAYSLRDEVEKAINAQNLKTYSFIMIPGESNREIEFQVL